MRSEELYYFIVYKPFMMLSQFTSQHDKHQTLADINFDFPKDVYAVGRLDSDSEGGLLITNDKALNARVLHPTNKHSRSYLVQVEGAITEEALSQLRAGVDIRPNKKDYHTLPCKAEALENEPVLPERVPPIRERKNIPTTWIRMTLIEGKNRQVRRMTAKVGFPTLRLVRESIEGLNISGMQPGEVKPMTRQEVYLKLFGEKV